MSEKYYIHPCWHSYGALVISDSTGLIAEMVPSTLLAHSPANQLLTELSQSGRDVTDAKIELEGLRQLAMLANPAEPVRVELEPMWIRLPEDDGD